MNITEANQINTLLRWLLDLEHIDVDAARAAAVALAGRAQLALKAGITEDDVNDRWAWSMTVLARALESDCCDDPDCPCRDIDDEPPGRPIQTIVVAGELL